jgi:hypothetical protein
MSDQALAVLDNLQRHMLGIPVADVLARRGIEPESSDEFDLRIDAEIAYRQGVEWGDDVALLDFLDRRTRHLGRKSTGAQAELLGVGSATEEKARANMRQIRHGVQQRKRHIPPAYRDHLFADHMDEIQMPDRFAEWANGMTAAVQYLHDIIGGSNDGSLPKFDPLWFASLFLAFTNPTWIEKIKSGPAEEAFVLGQRHVSNAAEGLNSEVEVTLTHGLLLYGMCRTYGEAIALSLYLLPHRRAGGNSYDV